MEEKEIDIKWDIDLYKGDHARLFGLFGNKPVIFVLSAVLQEILYRMNIVEKELGYEVLYVSKDVQGLVKSSVINKWVVDPITALNYCRIRANRNNTLWFTIHSSVNWQSLSRLREVLPDAKIVSYVYDWQNLFVPKDKLHVWNQYAEEGEKYAGEEIKVIEQALEGKMCDAIIHGDFGPNWPYLTSRPIPCGSLFMPRSCLEEQYQPPPPLDIEDRCLFIGTLVDKKRFAQKDILFPETNIENLLEKICDAGYKIDLFTLFPRPEVVEVFRSKFPHNKVRIHQGMIVKNLLPVLSKRFKFGLMLLEHTTNLTEAHDAVSLPTKFFTYLALGVPIIVSERFKSLTRIVRENNCGIAIPTGEEYNFGEIIKRYDYKKLQEGVLGCRYQFKAENYNRGFVSIIKNVIELPYEKTVAKRIESNGTNSSRT